MAAQRQLCRVPDWRLAEQTDFDYQAFRLPSQGVFLRDSAAEILTKHSPTPAVGPRFSSDAILTFPWARKNSPVGAQIMPNGDAVTTPIMHLADLLTESFLSRIKDKQENGADFRIFAKKEREKG